MFELGSVYTAAIDVRDDSGVLVTPATVTLTLTLPDGTTFTPTVPAPSVAGQLRYDYSPPVPGHYKVKWVTTGPQIAYTDVFDVKDDEPPMLMSLADMKQTLGIDPQFTDDDDELRAKLAAITSAIEHYKSEVVVPRTVTEDIDGVQRFRRVRLSAVPVIAIISVQSQDGNTVYNPANLKADVPTGYVKVMSGPPLVGDLTFVTTAGYRQIPYNYIEGGKVLLSHIWESRRGPGGTGGVVGPEELADFRHYTALPRKAMDWLGQPRPYAL
jgi:hypothetical protein